MLNQANMFSLGSFTTTLASLVQVRMTSTHLEGSPQQANILTPKRRWKGSQEAYAPYVKKSAPQ